MIGLPFCFRMPCRAFIEASNPSGLFILIQWAKAVSLSDPHRRLFRPVLSFI